MSRLVLDDLLASMVEARRAGLSFEVAWKRSVRSVLASLGQDEATEWEVALHQTSAAWRRSYAREPTPHTDALAALGAL